MATTYNTLKTKNGVELREIVFLSTGEIVCYEIYMDGEWINKFKDKREASSMWKDFAG